MRKVTPMHKRQSRILINPKLIFHDKESFPILELNVDKFPLKLKPDWSPCVIAPTRKWIKKTGYRGRGTIWIVHNISLNFGHEEWVHVIFLITQGFCDSFFGYLLEQTKAELGDLVTCLDQMLIHKGVDGWSPLVHVEQGRVFIQSDAEEWGEK